MQGLQLRINRGTLDLKPLNPQSLNPKTYTLNLKPYLGAVARLESESLTTTGRAKGTAERNSLFELFGLTWHWW